MRGARLEKHAQRGFSVVRYLEIDIFNQKDMDRKIWPVSK